MFFKKKSIRFHRIERKVFFINTAIVLCLAILVFFGLQIEKSNTEI